MDNHWNVGFILKGVKLLSDKNAGETPPIDVFSYWVVSDVFDESSGPSGSYILAQGGTLPFGRVFGLMTFQGVRKAAFNAFKMLNYLGPKRLMSGGGTGSDGVDAMATMSAEQRRAADPRLQLLHDVQHHRHRHGDRQRQQPARGAREQGAVRHPLPRRRDAQQPLQRLDQPGQADEPDRGAVAGDEGAAAPGAALAGHQGGGHHHVHDDASPFPGRRGRWSSSA